LSGGDWFNEENMGHFYWREFVPNNML